MSSGINQQGSGKVLGGMDPTHRLASFAKTSRSKLTTFHTPFGGSDSSNVSEPGITRPNLFNINSDCRRIILKMLVNRKQDWSNTVIDNDISHIYVRNCIFTNDTDPKTNVPSVKILFVCRQLFVEGFQVLSDSNDFRFTLYAWSCGWQISDTMKHTSMQHLRKLTLNLVYPELAFGPVSDGDELGGFLSSLNERIIYLADLT